MKPYYDHGGITIFHGDCRDVIPLVAADVLVTDPPWGLDGSSGTINEARAKAVYRTLPDTLAEVRSIYVPAVRAALAMVKRGAVFPGVPHMFEYPKPDDVAVVIQPACAGMSKWGRATWQPVLFYGRDPRVGLTIRPLTIETRIAHNDEGRGHPCPKPMEIVRAVVERAAMPGEVVLDIFAGTGTTLRAAKDLGLRAIGIEIEERYCEIAAKRLSQEVLFPARETA